MWNIQWSCSWSTFISSAMQGWQQDCIMTERETKTAGRKTESRNSVNFPVFGGGGFCGFDGFGGFSFDLAMFCYSVFVGNSYKSLVSQTV